MLKEKPLLWRALCKKNNDLVYMIKSDKVQSLNISCSSIRIYEIRATTTWKYSSSNQCSEWHKTRTPHFRSSLPATALLLPVSPLSTYFPLDVWNAEKLPIPCHGWSWKDSSFQRFIAGELWWTLNCFGFSCLSTSFPNRCQASCAAELSGLFDCAVALGLNDQKE